jgi:glycosyltransferase involved in cell wall biosynthesis
MLLKNKVLIVGQTPPPYGGQAIAIKNMVDMLSEYSNVLHIRVGFADEMNDLGKFRVKKIVELFRLIFAIYRVQFNEKCDILYYPAPGGLKKGPLLKDILIIASTRFLFKKPILHFHAGGLNVFYQKLNFFYRFILFHTFKNSDLGIVLSSNNSDDAKIIKSQKIEVMPLGIKDVFFGKTAKISKPLQLLFVGVLKESKGVLVLLEACIILRLKKIDFILNLIGKFDSLSFELFVLNFIKLNNLTDNVNLCGVKIDEEKFDFFANADIFCFPTFFESETFGIVNIEAMMFELPVISTNWRGIPDIIEDGTTGYLCPIKNPEAIADKIETLYRNPKLRIEMGKSGRVKFLKNYTLDVFKNNIVNAFDNC